VASFNKTILVGNLTRDVEVKYIPNGTAVAVVGLAVNREWFDKASNSKKTDVTFVDVKCWGRTAEIAGEYLQKGSQVLFEGRLQTESWDDRQTGQKRSKLVVVAESMTMLGSKGGGQQRSEPRQEQKPESTVDPGQYFPDDGDPIPF